MIKKNKVKKYKCNSRLLCVQFIYIYRSIYLGFPGGSDNKRICPPMQKTSKPWVLSLGREGPLEKGMATNSSILAWRIPRTEDLASYKKI